MGSVPTLRSRRDFARLQASGRARSDRLMVVRSVPNALGHDRFGISTSRRVGGAVTRNRIRRRIKELLRASVDDSAALDVLIIVRPASSEATFEELGSSLRHLLSSARSGHAAGAVT